MKYLLIAICFLVSSLEGVEMRTIEQAFYSLHIVEIDPADYTIGVVRAEGGATVRELAEAKGAAVAINGGFFTREYGPAGLLKVDGEWYGSSKLPRGAIGWKKDGQQVLMDRVAGGSDGLYPIEDLESAPDWEECDFIVGGTPLLIWQGERTGDHGLERTRFLFRHLPHARSAVGVLPNGHWLFVAVDGPNPIFRGMSVFYLAKWMERLGCEFAVNLDGGGSSTLVVDGKIVNYTRGDDLPEQGKQVDRVANAIIAIPRSR